MHTQFIYEFYVIHTMHFSYIQNALSKMEYNTNHTTQFMLHANSLMFRHQGDILSGSLITTKNQVQHLL